MKKIYSLYLLFFLICSVTVHGENIYNALDGGHGSGELSDYIQLKEALLTENGTLYSYLVLLISENPHFLNVLMDLSIGYDSGVSYEKLYLLYMNQTADKDRQALLQLIYSYYKNPQQISQGSFKKIEAQLRSYGIVTDFVVVHNRLVLDYCILGKRHPIVTKHPFFVSPFPIYNIEPDLLYDEFYSSNSTFYRDLVFIDKREVKNDYEVAHLVLSNQSVAERYYIGSKVTADIAYCLKAAFAESKELKQRIENIFIVHELTHKIIQGEGYSNLVVEEALAIASTIFSDPYLGLATAYSYANYSGDTPHRAAALHFFDFCAATLNIPELTYHHSRVREFSPEQLQYLAKLYYNHLMVVVNEEKKCKQRRLERYSPFPIPFSELTE